jgi:excisionase family DNA binding protein
MIDQTRLYTLREVAEILRLNPQTLYNNIRRGKLKASKVGREYRFTAEQVQDIIKNGFTGNKVQ